MKPSSIALLGILATSSAWAAVAGSFTYQGKLTTSDGSSPITGTVTLRFEIYDPSAGCLLLREDHTGLDLNSPPGVFSVKVGGGTRAAGDPGHSMANIFRSTGTVGCYSPAAGDTRRLRVTVDPLGTPYTLSPDQTLTSVPQAFAAETAETLQGLAPSAFVQTGAASSISSTMLAADSVTSGKILDGTISPADLAGGTYSINISGNAAGLSSALAISGDVTGNSGASTVTKIQGRDVDPTAPSTNQVLKWNGSQWAPGADTTGAGVSSVGVSAPLSVLNPTTTPAISITQASAGSDGYLAAADFLAFTNKQTNALTSGRIWIGNGSNQAVELSGTTTNDLLKWNGSAWVSGPINAGTIGGTTSISTSGSITGSSLTSAGTIVAGDYIKVNTSAAVCGAPTQGAIRLNGANIEFCNGAAWMGVASGMEISALTGDVTASGSGSVAATISANAVDSGKIADGSIMNVDINAAAAIADTKLATISSAGKVNGTAISGTLSGVTIAGPSSIGGTTSISTTGTISSGAITSSDYVRVATSAAICNAGTSGAIRMNGSSLQYCDGSAWTTLGAAGSGITALTGDVVASGVGSVGATIAASAVDSSKIADGSISNVDINAAAAIADTKLATISTAGKVNGSAINGTIGNATIINTSGAGTFGSLRVTMGQPMQLDDADSSNNIKLRSPATLASDLDWTLPSNNGSNGQFLTTNGSGTLSWTTAAPSLPGLPNAQIWIGNSGTATATAVAGDGSLGSTGTFIVNGIKGSTITGMPAVGNILQYNGSNWVFITPSSAATANALVQRDGTGAFSAGAITSTSLNAGAGVIQTTGTISGGSLSASSATIAGSAIITGNLNADGGIINSTATSLRIQRLGSDRVTADATGVTLTGTTLTMAGPVSMGANNLTTTGTVTAGTLSGTLAAANVSGTLVMSQGGTGTTAIPANNAVVMNPAGTQMIGRAPGAVGNVLVSDGTSFVSGPAPAMTGRQVFTTSGVFNVPANVNQVYVQVWGGGGGGSGRSNTTCNTDYPSGGGGGGYAEGMVGVTPSGTVTVTVGTGGVGGTGATASCTAGGTYSATGGGNSSFGGMVVGNGGTGGKCYNLYNPTTPVTAGGTASTPGTIGTTGFTVPGGTIYYASGNSQGGGSYGFGSTPWAAQASGYGTGGSAAFVCAGAGMPGAPGLVIVTW
ncbi:MAG: hypothetical protein JNL01_01380 [Bdellovibrionales bacterium]|nr:hypothetical protein [Bdellovibrionales bacterium]